MCKTKTLVGILIIALLLTAYSFPYSLGKLRGTIKDEKGVPLVGADISLLSLRTPAKLTLVQANHKGEFSIDKLPPGEYALKATHTGYKPVIKSKINVAGGRITALSLILQVLDLKGGDNDPQNWDIKTMLRAGTDRRLIFREDEANASSQEGVAAVHDRVGCAPLLKNSSLKILSHGNTLGDHPFALSELSTSVAFSAWNGVNNKYIFAGQLNPWHNSIWKVKNILSHKVSPDQTLNWSFSYGKAGYLPLGRAAIPGLAKELSSDNFGLIQTVSLGFENEAKLFNFLTLVYGFGYDQVRSAATRSFINPELQILITPSPSVTFKGLVTSKRYRETDTLTLPEGDVVNIGDPVQFTQLGRDFVLNNTRHFEAGLVKKLAFNNDMEASIYSDKTSGGYTFLRLATDQGTLHSLLLPLRNNQLDSEGFRFLWRKQWLDFLSGSVAYIYATGAEFQKSARPIVLSHENLSELVKKGSFHVVSAQIDADLTKTRTSVTTILKWMPRTPINTINLFGDYKEVSNNGVNLFVRQYLPVPEFLNLIGGWEALVDIRNVLDQHSGAMVTAAGDVLMVKNPRSFRGGILFKF